MDNNLFFICSECFLEQKLTSIYGPNSFFLTGLGSVFDFDNIAYLKEIDYIIEEKQISNIYIVVSENCKFLENTFNANTFSSNTEKFLAELYADNFNSIDITFNLKEKINTLALLNIERQILRLRQVDASGKPYVNLNKVKGLFYKESINEFKEVIVV